MIRILSRRWKLRWWKLKRRVRKRVRNPAYLCLCVVLVVGVLWGAMTFRVHHPAMRLQRARIALAHQKPDLALQFADSLLTDQPTNVEALCVKARAHMMAMELEDARLTLDRLIIRDPDLVDAHRLRAEWALLWLHRLSRFEGFATDPQLREQYDQTVTLGRRQADWLAAHDISTAETRFLRARFAQADLYHLRTMQQLLKKTPTSDAHPDNEVEGEALYYAGQIQIRLGEIAEHLGTVIALEPRHCEAWRHYAALLVEGEDWPKLWWSASEVSELKNLPLHLSAAVSDAVLAIPDSVRPVAQRIGLGRKLLAHVKPVHHSMPLWRLTRAKLHLLADEPGKTQLLVEEILEVRPNQFKARLLLARSLFNQQMYEEAVGVLEPLAAEMPRAAEVQALYGLALMQTGDTDSAESALRDAVRLDAGEGRAEAALLALMGKQGRAVDVEDDVRRYYRRNSENPLAIRLMLQVERAGGNDQEIATLLSDVERILPLGDEHLAILLEGYRHLGDIDKTKQLAREMILRRPEALAGHLALAEATLSTDEEPAGRLAVRRLEERFPHDLDAKELVGKWHLRGQRFDRAVELLQEVIDHEPDRNGTRLLLAQALVGLSLTEQALAHVDRVLAEEPQNVSAAALVFRINRFTGEPEGAADYLARLDQDSLDEETTPSLLARVKFREGEFDKAAAICRRAIAAGRDQPILRVLLAAIHSRRNRPLQAENQLLAMIHSAPEDPQAYFTLSRFYLQRGEIERGLAVLHDLRGTNESLSRLAESWMRWGAGQDEAALKVLVPAYGSLVGAGGPAALTAADLLAAIHLARGDAVAAQAGYEPLIAADLFTVQALLRQVDLGVSVESRETLIGLLGQAEGRLDPQQGPLHAEIISRYAHLGRPDRALVLLDRWIESHPRRTGPLLAKGDLLIALGRPTQAVNVIRGALSMTPDDVRLWRRLSRAYLAVTDYPAAESALRNMGEVDAQASIESASELASMYTTIGLGPQAVRTLQQVEHLGTPRPPAVLLSIGRTLIANGLHEQAWGYLTEVPPAAPQYPAAQVSLADIEYRDGLTDRADLRLEALLQSPRTREATVRELLAAETADMVNDELVRKSVKLVNLEELPEALHARWLRLQVTAAASRSDWRETLNTLDRLSKREPDSLPIHLARIAILTHQGRMTEAREFFRSAAELPTAQLGPLVAAVLGEPAQVSAGVGAWHGPPEGQTALGRFLEAVLRGDLQAASRLARTVTSPRAVLATDLLASLHRSDPGPSQPTEAYRRLALAYIAYETGLPELCAEISLGVMDEVPTLTLGHALHVQTQLDRDRSTTDALARLGAVAPDSGLSLLLSAREKVAYSRYPEAIDDLRELLSRGPGNRNILYLMSQLLVGAGQADAAIDVLEELYVGSDLRPSAATNTGVTLFRREGADAVDFAVANDLAYLLAEHRPDRLEEAHRIASEAAGTSDFSAPILDTLGWIEHLMGNDSRALSHLCRAVTLANAQPQIHAHIADVYRALGIDAWSRYHRAAVTNNRRALAAPASVSTSAGQVTIAAH